MSVDHLPALTNGNAPEKPPSARLAKVNFSLDDGGLGGNSYYQRLARSYTQPEFVVPHQVAQSYTTHTYADPGPSM